MAVLGASSYTYAEATRDAAVGKLDRAPTCAPLSSISGVPKLVVPDNTKTGVTKACRYDPDLNPTYQEMAMHYGVGVVPARPYKPRDKAYVSYCTSSRLCKGESGLFGPSASLAL